MLWGQLLLSGLVGAALGSVIASKYQFILETRRVKMDVLRRLLGNRNIFVDGDPHDPTQRVLFTQALNEVLAVFGDSQQVRNALKAFKERTPETANTRMLELFKTLCGDLKIETKPLNDDFFMQPFILIENKKQQA